MYRTQLRAACAVNVFDIAILTNDATQFTFDNQYFRDIQSGHGLFTVDNAISTDPRTAPIVSLYAANLEGVDRNARLCEKHLRFMILHIYSPQIHFDHVISN
jgi:hypothetical protein